MPLQYLPRKSVDHINTLITYFRMLSEPDGEYVPEDMLVFKYAIENCFHVMPILMKLEHRCQEDGSEPPAPYQATDDGDGSNDGSDGNDGNNGAASSTDGNDGPTGPRLATAQD